LFGLALMDIKMAIVVEKWACYAYSNETPHSSVSSYHHKLLEVIRKRCVKKEGDFALNKQDFNLFSVLKILNNMNFQCGPGCNKQKAQLKPEWQELLTSYQLHMHLN
jgi:hypothetical protein